MKFKMIKTKGIKDFLKTKGFKINEESLQTLEEEYLKSFLIMWIDKAEKRNRKVLNVDYIPEALSYH